ncbi:MAG: pilus assembly protein PilM [Fibrobacter sp.]|nr:pilus assembly protein PilM [Fibrobacter sp.]
MKKKSRYISGLDIQKDYISIAQYSIDESAVLLIAIQPVSQQKKNARFWENSVEELKNLKGKFKFQSPDLVFSVPSEYAIVKRIKADNDEDSLDELVRWELKQNLNDSIDDYLLDYQELSSDESHKEYLAVAYRKDTVEPIFSVLKSVKLKPVVLDLDIFALINVFEANYEEYLSVPSVIVYGEMEKTKLILCKDGEFIDFQCFEYNYGVLEPDTYSQMVKKEVFRILSINGYDFSATKLFLSGSVFSQTEYTESISRQMDGNGELLDPFKKIACRVGIDEERLRAYLPQLSVSVGLALRGND